MSRRKQGRPQQRKALDSLEQERDLLVCGDCQTSFPLHDIVTFIKHKKQCCDKENLRHDNHNNNNVDDGQEEVGKGRARCGRGHGVSGRVTSDGDDPTAASRRADEGIDGQDDEEEEDDEDDEGVDVSKASRKEAAEDLSDESDDDGDDDEDDEDTEEEKDKAEGDTAMETSGQDSMIEEERRRRKRRKMRRKKRLLRLKQEQEDRERELEVKKERRSEARTPLRPKQVDAESNTIHSEPSRFVCETCRSTYTSAWALLQHAQKEHGMKIYTSPSSSTPPAASATSTSTNNSHGRETRQHHRSPSATSTPIPSNVSPMDLVVTGTSPRLDHQTVTASTASATSHYGVHHAPNPFTSPFRLPGLDARVPQVASLSPYGRTPPSGLDFDLITDYRLRPPFLSARPGLDPSTVPFPPPGHPFHERGRAAHISPVLGDFYSMQLKQLAGSPILPAGSGSKSPFSAAAASAALAHQQQLQQQQARAVNDRLTPTHGYPSNSSKVAGTSPADTSPRAGSTKPTDTSISVNLPPKLKSCEFCGKSFRFQSNLVVHRRSHTGEKPYKCPLCPHACTQQSKLKRHMKTHASPKSGTAGEGEDVPSDTTHDRKEGADDEDDEDEEEEEEEGEDEEEVEIMEEEMNEEERAVLESMQKAEKSEEPVVPEPGEIRHQAKRIKLEDDKETKEEVEEVNGEHEEGDVDAEEEEEEEEEEKPSDLSVKRKPVEDSVLSEVMKNSGLASIQTYTEAYEAALAENQVNGQDVEDDKKEKASSGRRQGGQDGSPVSPRQGVKREREAESDKDHIRKDHLFLGGTDLLAKAAKRGRDGAALPPGWPATLDGLTPHPAALDPATAAAAASLYSRLPHPAWFHPDSPVRLFFPGYPPRFPPHPTPRDLSIAADNNSNRSGLNLSHSAVATTSSNTSSNNNKSSALPASGGSPSIPALYKPALNSPPNYHHRSRGTSSTSSSPNSTLHLPSNGSASSTPRKPENSKRNDTCEYCGKVFKNCSNLTVHRRSHTGEKPYKCTLCNYACAQSSKLTRHMKTHGRLGKDVYTCKFCNMPFSVPSTLEKHMRKCVENRNAHLLAQDSGDLSSESAGAASLQSEPADMSGRQSEPLDISVKKESIASVH